MNLTQKLMGLILILCYVGLTGCTPTATPPTIATLETDTSPPTQVPTTPTTAPLPEATSTPNLPTATPTHEPTVDLSNIRLNFWHPWTGDKEFAILTMVNKFNATNEYGIVVTAFSQGGDLYQGIRAGINAGMLPHLTASFTNQIQSWDNHGGVIVDLNQYIHDPVWGLTDLEQEAYFPEFWNIDVNANGKRLGFPVYRYAMVLFYNQTWAQELGFSAPPQTPAEFKEQACAAAAHNNNGTGGWIANTDTATIMSWLQAFGATGVASNGDGYDFSNYATTEAFEFIKSMFASGCAWIPETYYPNDEFATRQGLFYSSSIAGLPYQGYAMENNASQDEWQVLPYPSTDGQGVINMTGASYAMFESSEAEQLASWIFIHWLIAPENQAAMIEASGYFPTSDLAYANLEKYTAENPQWAQAQTLIPLTQTEPIFGSWGIARWAVQDAAEELINPTFASADIPILLETLNETLAEIHLENR